MLFFQLFDSIEKKYSLCHEVNFALQVSTKKHNSDQFEKSFDTYLDFQIRDNDIEDKERK